MKFFLDNIELILSFAGLLVILFVPWLFFPNPDVLWSAAAITAIVVGILHGVIFWFIRRRQRHVREQAIEEIKLMMQDIVNNQLFVISANAAKLDAERVHRVQDSISKVSELVNTLSEESLSDWKTSHAEMLEKFRSENIIV
jgi:uncharacterized protein HemX